MIAGSKRVAYSRLSARQIIYSEEETSRGFNCGERINLFLKNFDDDTYYEIQDYSPCKLEIFLWLGNAKFINACWSAIPSGYEVNHLTSLENFPRFIQYTESSVNKKNNIIYKYKGWTVMD